MSSGESRSPDTNLNNDPTVRSETEAWYIFREGRHFGPFSAGSILIYLKRGFISKQHSVWRSGFKDWQMISQLAEFDIVIKEEALSLTDQQFIELAALNREDLVGFHKRHQAAKAQMNAVPKSKFIGVADLYDSIRQKLNFKIKDNLSESEK